MKFEARAHASAALLAAGALAFAGLGTACGGGGNSGGSGGSGGGATATSTGTGSTTSGTSTSSGTGSSGTAGGGMACPGGCDDKDPCTDDICDPAQGCTHAPLSYFKETFDSNAAGWALDPGWQIGAATISSGQAFGYGTDPASDHTADKAGGGIAGVFIGGNVPNAVTAASYLTTPILDLSKVSGTVVLEFYRILNADLPPYMTSTVEAYDGSAWVPLYPMPAQTTPIQENTQPGMTAWTKVQYDVSAQAAGKATFKVRWGYSVGQIGVQKVGSWNVDDVRLLPAASCP